MYKITYKSGRVSHGVLASDEQSARRAGRWLHPDDAIVKVEEVMPCC